MDFTRRKLPREAATKLRNFPIASVRPYVLMLAPVYVFMRLNEKFVAVKAPLDFFSPAELEKLKPLGTFFLPEFIETVIPFQTAARTARALLVWDPGDKHPGTLPPAPYELSDAILRMIGPLWSVAGKDVSIEPYFVAVFVNELCDPIAPAVLEQAREKNMNEYERALLASSWAVFLALHLGHCDLEYLNRVRRATFDHCLSLHASDAEFSHETSELIRCTLASLGDPAPKSLSRSDLSRRSGQIFLKMASRLDRVLRELAKPGEAFTVFGKKGFVDV